MLNWFTNLFAADNKANRGSVPPEPRPAAQDASSEQGRAFKTRGNAFLKDGRLTDAELCYRQAIVINPEDPEALINLGFVLSEQRLYAEAEQHLRLATTVAPQNHDAFYLLGTASEMQGKLEVAIDSFKKAIELKPDFDFCRRDLCRVLFQTERFDAAKTLVSEGIALNPQFADFHYYLGNLLSHEKALDKAINSYHHALAIQPDYAEVHNNLGKAFCEQGNLEAAIQSYQKASSITPDDKSIHNNMGDAFNRLGQVDAALKCWKKAFSIKKGDADALNNLGCSLAITDKLEAAIKAFKESLLLKPEYAEAENNLGGALLTQGNLDVALESYYKAIALKSDFKAASDGLLFTLNYHPDKSAAEIFSAYCDYDTRFGLPLRDTWREHTNRRESNRRLKVGYISPDFRHHSTRHFLEPLLANHNKEVVTVYAYAELAAEDEVTARYRACVDHWIPTRGLAAETLAEQIRRDEIDILVDLAGHTTENRLEVFARKPAPVSVSWLGYGYTTGLTAIDYLLTDATSTPAGSETLFSETPWRLQTPGYAYRPAEGMGMVSVLPALERGYVTLGTLTRAVRVNHRTVRVWAEILKRVPGSRLVVDSRNYQDASVQADLANRFGQFGIGRERLEIGCHSPPWDVLRGIDIGLDCFPHNSGTTLFETLYMGIPYVTLAGRPSVGRLGSTILEGIGHPEWIANTEEQYIEKTVALAADLTRLSALRAGLRAEMKASPLMDEAGFTRKVEAAYRGMFTKWCEGTR